MNIFSILWHNDTIVHVVTFICIASPLNSILQIMQHNLFTLKNNISC